MYKRFNGGKELNLLVGYVNRNLSVKLYENERGDSLFEDDGKDSPTEKSEYNIIHIEIENSPFSNFNETIPYTELSNENNTIRRTGYTVVVENYKIEKISVLAQGGRIFGTIEEDTEEYGFLIYVLKKAGVLKLDYMTESKKELKAVKYVYFFAYDYWQNRTIGKGNCEVILDNDITDITVITDFQNNLAKTLKFDGVIVSNFIFLREIIQ